MANRPLVQASGPHPKQGRSQLCAEPGTSPRRSHSPWRRRTARDRFGNQVLVRNDVDTDDRFSRIPIASVVCL
jgi:hypothetical protein